MAFHLGYQGTTRSYRPQRDPGSNKRLAKRKTQLGQSIFQLAKIRKKHPRWSNGVALVPFTHGFWSTIGVDPFSTTAGKSPRVKKGSLKLT